MKDRELDLLNSACCRVKGVELSAGDILDGKFPSLLGAEVHLRDGTAIPIHAAAEIAQRLMKLLLPPMRAALRELQQRRIAENRTPQSELSKA